MTRDNILRMAREAGLTDESFERDWYVFQLGRFAALVAAAEREACAKVCEEQKLKYEARVARPEQFRTIHPETARIAAMTCDFNAAAIRERGSDA